MSLPRFSLLLALPVLTSQLLVAQSPGSRDSAGVRITQNPSRMTFPVNLKLGATASYDIGGLHEENPDEEFDANQGYLRGVRLSNGGMAVIDVKRVKYFDAKGKLVKVAGRDGEGPGEYRYLTSICRTRGDTIVVADRKRLAVLDGRGNFVRHIPSTPRYLPFDGCFEDGTVLLTETEYRKPTPNSSTAHLYRVSLDGTVVTPLGDMVVSGFDMVTQTDVAWVAAGRRLFVGDGSRGEIPVMQLLPLGEGAPSTWFRQVASIRSADRGEKISTAEIEEQWANTIPRNTPESERKERMERMRAMPHATVWPTFGRIHADPDGNLWVADYRHVYPSSVGYSKFDRNGKLVGRLVIPPQTKLSERREVIGFGRNEMLVRRWDEDGGTHLTVFPIVPLR